jgi:PilZ domain
VTAHASERRLFPRINASVVWRPAGLRIVHHQRRVQDLSLAGMRVRSDEVFWLGQRLECEVLPSNQGLGPIRVWGRVAWVAEAAPATGARFEVGIQFTDLADTDVRNLAALLSRDEPAPSL